MHASRRRHGSCLLMILASAAVLAGLVMTAIGSVLFVRNSQQVAMLERTYHRQADRVRELNRRGRARGPLRDRFTDAEIKKEMESVGGTLELYGEAEDGRNVGLSLLAAGIVTTLVGGMLFVLSVVLLIMRRALSKPAPTPDAAPPPVDDSPPQPAFGPE